MGKDDYEAGYMHGDDVLYREKHVSKIFAAIMAVPAVIATVGGIAAAIGGEPMALVPTLFAASMIAGTTLLFAVMRVTVSSTHLSVQYGMLGPTIPASAITSCAIEELDALSQLAFGAKIGSDGWRYIPYGVTHGVRVKWREGDYEKQCLIGAEDPKSLARAIEQARAGAKLTHVRVDADEDEEVEVERAPEKKTKRARR